METELNPRLSAFEEALLDSLLAGDHPVLLKLREQRALATCVSRELSGAGFFLTFSLPESAGPIEPGRFILGDVLFDLKGLDHGGGALLFIRGGKIEMLEAYCNGVGWPRDTSDFSIFYDTGPQRDVAMIMSAALSQAS